MKLQDMILTLQDRTKKRNDDALLVRELNSALQDVWMRLYEAYPNVQITFDTEGTFSAETQQFDLAAEIALLGGEFYGHKTFYIMDSNQNRFIPVVFMDVNDPRFQGREQETAQVLSPCYAASVNFGKVRFAPALPSGTEWRSDWIGKPPNLSLATNTQTSIPEPLHQAMTDKATAQVFNILMDDREGYWERKAENKILSAIHNIKYRQQQTPQRTAPFPGGQTVSGFRWNQG